MSVYNPSIPLSTDLISSSQPEIKENFGQLNSQFGIEHVAFNNGGSNGSGLHKQTTFPNLSVPTPVPSAAYGTVYGSKLGTVGGTITEAVYISGDAAASTNVAILSAIKAWGSFSGTSRIDGFNFASISVAASGTYNVSFTHALPNANYGVIVSGPMASDFTSGAIIGASSLSTSGFQINARSLTNPPFGVSAVISFMVLQS